MIEIIENCSSGVKIDIVFFVSSFLTSAACKTTFCNVNAQLRCAKVIGKTTCSLTNVVCQNCISFAKHSFAPHATHWLMREKRKSENLCLCVRFAKLGFANAGTLDTKPSFVMANKVVKECLVSPNSICIQKGKAIPHRPCASTKLHLQNQSGVLW